MRKPTLTMYRRGFQIAVALFFILIPILNRSDYSHIYGNYLSFHFFGIPFSDPLAVLQLAIKNFYLTTENAIGACLPLLLAFCLGTVFCSWLCAYGLLSEMTHKLSRKLLPRSFKGVPVYARGFPCKVVVFILGFVGFFIFSTTPVLNQLSLAAWYSRFFQYLFGQDIFSLCIFFLLGLLVVEFFAGKRLWCRYICPQSVLIILAKQCNRKRLQVAFVQEKCICKPGYERCDMACHLNLKPKTVHKSWETECTNCGDCVVACNTMGKALSFEYVQGRELAQRVHVKAGILILKKAALILLCVLLLIGTGYLTVPYLKKLDLDFSVGESKSTNVLLGDKKISWTGSQADFYEFLEDGTLVCVGGDWPTEGFKGWKWEAVDETGSFKIIQEASLPGSWTVARMKERVGKSARFTLQHYRDGAWVEGEDTEHKIVRHDALQASHEKTATLIDARATIVQYADQVYIQDLLVLDPGGKKIKKILSEGDLITTEGMLTAVHRWINSPVITASEGEPPKYPIHTRMELRFRDGKTKNISFVTTGSKDRSSEEFEDLWF